MEGVPEVVAPSRRRPLFYVEAQKGVRALADVSRMIDFKKKAAAKQLVFGEVCVKRFANFTRKQYNWPILRSSKEVLS